jgi:hypothetical protein
MILDRRPFSLHRLLIAVLLFEPVIIDRPGLSLRRVLLAVLQFASAMGVTRIAWTSGVMHGQYYVVWPMSGVAGFLLGCSVGTLLWRGSVAVFLGLALGYFTLLLLPAIAAFIYE